MSHHYDSEQQDSPRQSMPILKFSNKVVKAKPMTPLSCGMNPKSKFKIPTSPHRVMAAPGTFLHCGKFVC
jgi:cell division cycle protein 20 (cofactor of APC complex)